MAHSRTKRIVCLANSRKPSGRCIAGKEFAGGRPWIRPVSDRESGGVSREERQYEDGSDPRILDVIDIPLLNAQPDGCQRENWLLDPEYYWTRAGRFPRSGLDQLLDPVDELWFDGASTRNGLNDHIPLSEADSLESSLRFVHVDRLKISVSAPYTLFGDSNLRVKGEFRYAGKRYRLSVTDPVAEGPYRQKGDGEYQLGARYMTISLGEPWHEARYKLIAAIIPGVGSVP